MKFFLIYIFYFIIGILAIKLKIPTEYLVCWYGAIIIANQGVTNAR